MGLPQQWVVVIGVLGGFFGCICAALIYRRFTMEDQPLQTDPIALDEARLRAADRRERRLQREMEQLSRALQERKENLREAREDQEQLTHRIEGARTARSMGVDHYDSIAMAQPKSARGMFSHMNTPRQPRSARGAGSGAVAASIASMGAVNNNAAAVPPPSSGGVVPPLNFSGLSGSGGPAHHIDYDEVHFDIDKLSALAKSNPEVARELALGLAMRMSEEMNRSASADESSDGSSDDDASSDHQITIHGDGMGQRRTSSGMRSARLALEALGGVPADFKARNAAGSSTSLQPSASPALPSARSPYDESSGVPKRPPSSSGSSSHRHGHHHHETRAERAQRRQRNKKMLLSGKRTSGATAAGVTTSAARTADEIRADGWEPASARSLPTIGRDENSIQMMVDRINESGTDSSMPTIASLPPPRPVKIGAVPSASAVTDDDDVPVNIHIRHQPNPFGDDRVTSSMDNKRSPSMSPVVNSSPAAATAISSIPSSLSSSYLRPASTTSPATTTTSAPPVGVVHGWSSPARSSPASPLSPPTPPFARSRGQSTDEAADLPPSAASMIRGVGGGGTGMRTSNIAEYADGVDGVSRPVIRQPAHITPTSHQPSRSPPPSHPPPPPPDSPTIYSGEEGIPSSTAVAVATPTRRAVTSSSMPSLST